MCVACSSSSTSENPKRFSFKQQQLSQAILSVEANLGSLTDAGYVSWTPTTAVAELAKSLNASQVLLPEEKEQYKAAKIRPVTIPYTINKPTGSWQVVLIPDDANQLIRVQGYGASLEQPLMTKKIPCCSF